MEDGIVFSLADADGFAADIAVAYDSAAKDVFKTGYFLSKLIALFNELLQTTFAIPHIRNVTLYLGKSQGKNAFKMNAIEQGEEIASLRFKKRGTRNDRRVLLYAKILLFFRISPFIFRINSRNLYLISSNITYVLDTTRRAKSLNL